MSPRLRSTALVLLALPLAGCLKALWGWTDEDRVPDLETSRTACRIEAVLAPPGADPTSLEVYAVGFSPAPGQPAPAHLVRQASDGPAWLMVRPFADFAAAKAMDGFEPAGHELDVFDGRHLRRRTNNVRMMLYGTAASESVGSLIPETHVPTRLRDTRIEGDAIPPFGPLRRAVAGLATQNWTSLVTPAGARPPEGQPVPVAFLDASGRQVPLLTVAQGLAAPAGHPAVEQMASTTLLARVEDLGRTVYLRIPVPVLLNAEDLTMRRDGDRVAFAWARRGVGRFVRDDAVPAGLARFTLPLVDQNLTYEWSTELPVTNPLQRSIQTLLAPFAWIFDFLVETNPALRALRDQLFPPPPAPVRPRRIR